jgi:hypothetical protein
MPDWSAFQWAAVAFVGALVGIKYGIYCVFTRLMIPQVLRGASRPFRAAMIRAALGVLIAAGILAIPLHVTRSIVFVELSMLPLRPVLWWASLRATGAELSSGRLLVGAAIGTAVSFACDAAIFVTSMAALAALVWKDL